MIQVQYENYMQFIEKRYLSLIKRLYANYEETTSISERAEMPMQAYSIDVRFVAPKAEAEGWMEEVRRKFTKEFTPEDNERHLFALNFFDLRNESFSSLSRENRVTKTVDRFPELRAQAILIKDLLLDDKEDEVKKNAKIISVLDITVTLKFASPEGKEQVYSMSRNFHRTCAKCLKLRSTVHKLSRCAGCLKVSYCNRECQVADWSAHRTVCAKQAPENVSG